MGMKFPPQRPEHPLTESATVTTKDYTKCKFAINPYKGFSNHPYINIAAYYPEEAMKCTYHYVAADGLYWLQLPDGLTDFFYLRTDIQLKAPNGTGKVVDGYETTQNGGGYGGRDFNIRCIRPEKPEPIQLAVRGPWSGGCYCANNHLPQPATEVTFKHPSTYIKCTPTSMHWSHTAACLTVDVVNKMLDAAKSLWMVKLKDDTLVYPKTIINPKGKVEPRAKVPQLCYAEGQTWDAALQTMPQLFKRKEEWKPETIDMLDAIWKVEDKKFNLDYYK